MGEVAMSTETKQDEAAVKQTGFGTTARFALPPPSVRLGAADRFRAVFPSVSNRSSSPVMPSPPPRADSPFFACSLIA